MVSIQPTPITTYVVPWHSFFVAPTDLAEARERGKAARASPTFQKVRVADVLERAITQESKSYADPTVSECLAQSSTLLTIDVSPVYTTRIMTPPIAGR